jgi:hypothetical protein
MAMLGTTAALIGTALGWVATFLFVGVVQAYLPAPVATVPINLTGGGMASLAGWLPLLVASLAGLALWPLLAVLGGLGPAIHAARLPVTQALYEAAPP